MYMNVCVLLVDSMLWYVFLPPQTVSRGSSGTADEKSVQMTKVINDIHQMKGRQESIATVLDVLKQ